MKTNSGNPICPHDLQDCNHFDIDGHLDCKACPRYADGVRATGAMPGAELTYNFFKGLWYKIFK